jgi:plastocyanin
VASGAVGIQNIQRWYWQPDGTGGVVANVLSGGRDNVSVAADGSSSGGTVCLTNSTTCRIAVSQSGTMYVSATINGKVEQAGVHVEARPDSLSLSSSKTTVKPGEKVEFEAKNKSGRNFSVINWSWNGTPPGTGQAMTSSGTCGTGKKCEIPIYESGTTTVVAQLPGVSGTSTATASVTVTPCPPFLEDPDDPAADSPEFLKGITDELVNANVSQSASAGTRTERGGYIIRRPDGSVYFVPSPNQLGSNSCEYRIGSLPSLPAGHVVIGQAHIHPFSPGERLYNCRRHLPDGSIVPVPDGTTEPILLPSDADWSAARAGAGSTHFVLTKHGRLYRLNFPPNDGLNPESGRVREFRRDGSSICFTNKGLVG